MKFRVQFQKDAAKELERLRSVDRSAILEDADRLLGSNPSLESQSKVKKLRQPAPAEFRLRVGDYRIYYKVDVDCVTVLKVLHKADSAEYLEGYGNDDEGNR